MVISVTTNPAPDSIFVDYWLPLQPFEFTLSKGVLLSAPKPKQSVYSGYEGL